MAINLVAQALAAPVMPSQSSKLALVTLCDAADPDGSNCYPSLARVARNALCSMRQARRIVALFRDAVFRGDRRILTIVREGGGNHPTEYRLDVSLLADIALKGWDDLVVAVPGGAVTDDHTPDTGDRGHLVSGEDAGASTPDISTPTPDTRTAANPSLNPSIEPVERRAREERAAGDALPDAELLAELQRLAPTAAHDGRVDTEGAWRALSAEDRAKAAARYPRWLEAKGKRTAIAGLPRYLRERLFEFVGDGDRVVTAGADQAIVPAFDRSWWLMVHRYLERHAEALKDHRSPAAATLRLRIFEPAKQFGSGYRLTDPSKRAEIDQAAADLVSVHKANPAVIAWLRSYSERGIHIPLPDRVDWIFLTPALVAAAPLPANGAT